MYSEDFGSTWFTIASNILPGPYYYYLYQDFSWYVHLLKQMYQIPHTRGEPGVDWDTNNPKRSDLTKVYYSVIDGDATTYSKCLCYVYLNKQTFDIALYFLEPKLLLDEYLSTCRNTLLHGNFYSQGEIIIVTKHMYSI